MGEPDAMLDLPDELRAWVETAAGTGVTRAARHLAGASRQAWTVDLADGRPLFMLRDQVGAGGGSTRDAAILRALAPTAVPVPTVVAHDEALGAILLERVAGRSDFPAVDHDDEREPTARHLMEITGTLHLLDPDRLDLPHLSRPATARDHAQALLDGFAPMIDGLSAGPGPVATAGEPEPLFATALDWLRRNVPEHVERTSLVHSDMGPGNFLYAGGRVTAVLDWEVAHLGDPMEDLAAISIRDMATPVGHLPTRYREYHESSGITVALDRVRYYRVLVLTRNSLMLTLALARATPAMNVDQLTMYRMLLLRAAAIALADAVEHRPNGRADAAAAAALVERAHEQAAEMREVMGPLADRLPQPLEDGS
jgi:aminoglycoside phosphotransferase (APT) family kinase protein